MYYLTFSKEGVGRVKMLWNDFMRVPKSFFTRGFFVFFVRVVATLTLQYICDKNPTRSKGGMERSQEQRVLSGGRLTFVATRAKIGAYRARRGPPQGIQMCKRATPRDYTKGLHQRTASRDNTV